MLKTNQPYLAAHIFLKSNHYNLVQTLNNSKNYIKKLKPLK